MSEELAKKPLVKVRKLEIELQRWGEKAGTYSGKIEFENKLGKIELNIDDSLANKLIAICLEATVDCCQEQTNSFRNLMKEHCKIAIDESEPKKGIFQKLIS